ncbi:MAG: hypothetical protein PHV59_12925 [Victivallales bacterium]|nr:hypothetical protein [Victivallales bacterium]
MLEQELDYDEYLKWDAYFEYELTVYDKTDYQLAQIAMFCHMPVSDKKNFKLNEYLIEFKKPELEKNTEKVPPNILVKLLQSAFGVKDKK